MLTPLPLVRRLAGGALALAAGTAPALALGDAETSFHRAYFLENEEGAIQPALEIYRAVAADRAAPGPLRERASRRASSLAEELAASDLTRLVPAHTILYAELAHPGEELAALLDQLGLLASGGVTPGELGVSPALISGALGLRGLAVAVTEVDPRSELPSGVVIVHPGELDVLRGLIETLVPAASMPSEPIRGHATFALPEHGFVTFTSRLIIAGTSRAEIEGVVQRLHGEGGPSLAEHPPLGDALATRDGGMLWFCINAEPIKPMLHAMMEQYAQHDPEVAMAASLLDLDSLVGLAGRFGVREDGIALDLSLHLEEGHRNLVFNLMRMPNVDPRTLELVPDGVAFFGVSSLNPPSDVATGMRDSKGQPVVTWMDFGREWFGNVTDLAVFALPPDPHSPPQGPVPDFAAVVRVNDLERSRALWGLMLGLGSQAATGGQSPVQHVQVEGLATDVYDMGQVAVYVASDGKDLIVTPSRSALARTVAARKTGRSVLHDPLFAGSLELAGASSTSLLVASPGRCAHLAAPFLSPRERQQMLPIAQMLEPTVFSIGVEQSETHLALRARLSNLPDVSGLVAGALEQWKRREFGRHATVGLSAPAPVLSDAFDARAAAPAAALSLEDRFEQLARSGDPHAAHDLGMAWAESMGDDPRALNNFAWALLTEERYGQRFNALAREVSTRSNQLSEHGNWYYLDTLALACFRAGDIARAVELQERAVSLAGEDDSSGGARESLARYRAALSSR